MRLLLIAAGGLLFSAGAVGHLVVRMKIKPRDPELDEMYHEFEDAHPEVVRYERWTRLTLGAACVGMLLLFLGLAI